MPHLPDVVLWSIPAFVLLTVVEMVSYRLHPDEDAAGYEAKDAATSIGMGLGSLVFDALWKIPIVAVYAAVYELTPLRVPVLAWTLPLMLLVQDFFYYWSHRGHHVIRILWACHVVHHSSRKFNFTTALRQPWTTWTVWPFYLPMIALGVHPAAVAFCSSANLVYQFWVHTERIGKLPRPFEFVLNTPSHHRVHHASQGGYLDRNFGGILIVWDRMFGSFVPETERPVYGLTKNIDTFNPLRVATHEYVAIARDVRAADTWRERAGRVFRGPGWQPEPRKTGRERDRVAVEGTGARDAGSARPASSPERGSDRSGKRAVREARKHDAGRARKRATRRSGKRGSPSSVEEPVT
ncbi:sterol desaturase family protein [Streptomyces sp. NPDC003077]|uniref:sterol desaturase family protein n=1 Tax=Streptomyces sp. NPDC003077 TaxID=3154443 RepID=UPI0033B0269F